MNSAPAYAQCAVELENVTVAYNRHPSLHHFSGVFCAGTLTALCGPNGAGKSSLMGVMGGFLKPDAGKVHRQHSCIWMPQRPELDLWVPLKVRDFVSMSVGCNAWLPWRSHRSAVEKALHEVGLQGFAQRLIGTLSAGQLQRAIFARALLEEGRIVLLDEPFAGVDRRSTDLMMACVDRWVKEGRTVVISVHDLHFVRERFPQTLLLARQVVAWGDTADVLSDANLKRANTMAEEWEETAEVCELPS